MISWPTNLITDIARRQCVLFLGAGVSKNAKNRDGRSPKTWSEFLRAGIEQIANRSEKKVVAACIKNGDYLMACELLKRSLGGSKFIDLLRDEFQRPGFMVADIHKDIFLLDSRIVITPNFDKIYESYAANEAQGTIITKYYYDTDIVDVLRNDAYVILKIHGCIDAPNKLIFSKLDYVEKRSQYRSFYEILEALALTKTFIFIGAGLNDPDIQLLLENHAFRYKVSHKHYFILPKKYTSSRELEVYSESMNLEFILYDDKFEHKELKESIKDLISIVDSRRNKIATARNW